MPVPLAELEEIQSELLADDVAIPADAAGDWSDAEARVFFESGGRKRPVARRLRTLEALLAEATELENTSLELVGQFESLRMKTSDLWSRVQALEVEIEEARKAGGGKAEELGERVARKVVQVTHQHQLEGHGQPQRRRVVQAAAGSVDHPAAARAAQRGRRGRSVLRGPRRRQGRWI